MKITLTHDSDHPGAEGMPGDVIDCDDAIAKRFIEGRGAVAYVEPEAPEQPKPEEDMPLRKPMKKTVKKPAKKAVRKKA